MTLHSPVRRLLALLFLLILFVALVPAPGARGQDDPPAPVDTPLSAEEVPEAPEQVEVEPTAGDRQIDERLTRILLATEWFLEPKVRVQEGVVFLDGRTLTPERRDWAGNLARNTQDVVAVVNRIEVIPRPLFDFSPTIAEFRALWRAAVQAIPLFVLGTLILGVSWWLSGIAASLTTRLMRERLGSPLLTLVVARSVAIPVFLLGIYLVLQVAGLTRLALTLLGGTGIVGIVVGFAFRDIAENFLASVLLSMRQPFARDDYIEVAEHAGIVQQMNTRSTVLMTLEGNHVQIPNAIIFKNTITNYTANPNRRAEFTVGIGYEDNVLTAQEVIARVLAEHPAVLQSPEPLVLVEALGASSVTMRVYYWTDATQFSPLKIKSSLVRLTKRALEDANISMPDEAREVIFPKGVPLLTQEQERPGTPGMGAAPTDKVAAPAAARPEPVSSPAEGDLRSEDDSIREQAELARAPERGADLLDEDGADELTSRPPGRE